MSGEAHGTGPRADVGTPVPRRSAGVVKTRGRPPTSPWAAPHTAVRHLIRAGSAFYPGALGRNPSPLALLPHCRDTIPDPRQRFRRRFAPRRSQRRKTTGRTVETTGCSVSREVQPVRYFPAASRRTRRGRTVALVYWVPAGAVEPTTPCGCVSSAPSRAVAAAYRPRPAYCMPAEQRERNLSPPAASHAIPAY